MTFKRKTGWTPEQLGDLSGRRYLITGGNSGIGLEAARILANEGADIVIACRPGYSATSLQSTGPTGALASIYTVLNRVWAQSAHDGAIPTVLAAADEDARSGAYYGPGSLMESLGPVGEASISRRALDEKVAAALWQRSEDLVGHTWQFPQAC